MNHPNVKPDDITRFGKYLVLGANAAVNLWPDHSALPVVAYTVGGMADGVDGELADIKNKKDGIPTTIDGMMHDAKTDRLEEVITFANLSLLARRHGNRYAASLYAVATMTAGWSSLMRAEYESRGLIGGEGGLGSHADRLIMGGVGLGFNERPAVSNVVSELVVATSLRTTKDRWDILRHGSAAPHY